MPRTGQGKGFVVYRRVKTVADVVAWRMCMGCGACYSACDRGAVRLVDLADEGIRPVFDHDLCRDCAGCLDVCPGWQVDSGLIAEKDPRSTEFDHEYGPALELWEGYAADPEVRRKASSGGLLTALALYCLEHEGMSSVLHTGMDPEAPYRNRTFQSRSRDELLTRCGSRYAPASPCDGLRAIEDDRGSYVFVGKPCDVAAARMYSSRGAGVGGGLGLLLSFCCAGTPSTRGTVDLIRSLGRDEKAVSGVGYRGDGWPGGFTVTDPDHSDRAFLEYWKAWASLTKYVPLRCRLCPDGLGRLSDITVGDAWHAYAEGSGDAGRSIAIVRTERGREVLRRAREARYVVLNPIGGEAVLEAQRSLLARRRGLFGRLLALRLLGVPTPRYRGFSLYYSWSRLPFGERLRSITGTMRRVATRGWWRPQQRLDR